VTDEEDELPWLPGSRYAPESILGQGGNAVVYRTYDHDRSEWCAVKLLHKRQAKHEKARRRFLDEAEVLTLLDHRNVIHVRDMMRDAARPYIVMELAEGGSLMDWTRRNGPMPPRMAVDMAIQICKGVGAAHKLGVIHRDIKPHNILLNRRGVAKVTDFGIAQLPRKDGTTDIPDALQGSAAGTLGYMAPEQRKDARLVDPRTDVYSTGATLYTLLTGNTVTDLFIAERETGLLDAIPDVLRPVLLKAIAYQIDDRYPNMPALAKALFGLRQDLEPDPESTPPLIDALSTIDLEPPPRPPFEPPPSELSDTGAHRLKPATTPPTKLRTVTPAPQVLTNRTAAPTRPDHPLERRPLRLVAAVLVGVGLTTATLVFGAMNVRSAESSVTDAQNALFAVLDTELAIVDDLEALGADGDQLEKRYREQRTAAARERMVVARRYIELLGRNVSEHAGTTRSRDASSARERLGRIEGELSAYEDDLATWSARSRSFPGSLAVALGLAASAP